MSRAFFCSQISCGNMRFTAEIAENAEEDEGLPQMTGFHSALDKVTG